MGIRVNVDGRLGTEDDRLLSALDHGFVFGASVYETLRTYAGRPFLLPRHLARLRASAASLDIEAPLSDEEFARRVAETVAAADNPESYIRLIVSAGPGPLDYRKGASPRATAVVIVQPLPMVPETLYQLGVRVALVNVVRNHPRSVSPRIKSSSLLNNMLAMRQALARGAVEAILLNYKGEVAEGSQTNVFMVREGLLITPSLETGILEGITRELTLQIASDLGYEAVQTTFFPDQLLSADEVLLTSTTKEILPVVRIDETVIGDGVPGPVSQALLQGYRERARSLTASPHPSWK
jgi:branched-chain amino acid aminotransferase